MLKPMLIAISISCVSLGGCADLRVQLNSLLHNAPALPQPPLQPQVVSAGEIVSEDEQDSYFREYAPWRISKRRLKSPPQLRASSSSVEITGSSLVPELPPEDVEEFRQWLDQRREQSQQAHLAQEARFREMDRQALRSICVGC